MGNKEDNFYHFSPEIFQDEAYKAAVERYPVGSLVCLEVTGQVQKVEEVRATPDGPRLKVFHVGSVPIDKLRIATEEDIDKTVFKDHVEKRGKHFFFKE